MVGVVDAAQRAPATASRMAEAARRFDAFIKEAKSSTVPELHRLAKTMSRWRTEILAHHRSGGQAGARARAFRPPVRRRWNVPRHPVQHIADAAHQRDVEVVEDDGVRNRSGRGP